MQTEINLPFADGVYRFKLPLPMIHELQRKTNTGIGALFARVLKGRYMVGEESFGMPTEGEYRVEDVMETMRCGLIGGGQGLVGGETVQVGPPLALELMNNYAYPAAPLKEAWGLAASILMACIEGYEEPEQKKSPQETEQATDGLTTPSPLETSLSVVAVQ
jgi:hypothetical protein